MTMNAGSDVMFGDYTRQALDLQYNNRLRVPEYQTWFRTWAETSEETRHTLSCSTDIAYGQHPAETLDIFPAMQANAPANLFVHGGYWQSLDKSGFSYVARGFVPHGITTVVVNYALAPDASMDEIVRQNRASVAWLWNNAAELGIDRNRIHVSGHSAGGHLVAMLLATDWPRFAPGLARDVVRSGHAMSGLFDLEPIRLCYLNEVLGMDATEARRNSPVLIDYPRSTPLLISLGALESDEYHRQVRAMEKVWRDRDYPTRTLIADDHNHFTIADRLGDPESDIVAAQLALMED